MRRNSFTENVQCLQIQDAHLAETRQTLGPIRPEHQQRQREDQQFEGGENFDFYVDWKTGWRYHREPGRTPPAACSSSTSQWQTSQSQTSWSSWYPTSSEKWWWFRFPGRNSRKSTDGVDRTPTHKTHQCSTVCSQARNAHTTRSPEELRIIFVHPKVLSSGVFHVSSLVVLSRAFLHEHFLFFFTYLSYHTPRTLSTSRTSPSSLSRHVAQSKITLAWRPAQWRKPAHQISHTFLTKSNQTNKTKDVREPRRTLSANLQQNMRKQIPTTNTNLGLTDINQVPSSGTFWFQCYVVCLWGWWGSKYDDNQRPKSHNETCVKNPQLLWISCLTRLILILKFKFDTLMPNINSLFFLKKKTKVISHMTNGIIFFIWSTSPISAPLAPLRIPAW